ncbi:pilus assembly protein [Modestobacter sp. I12A-02628]|uniref:Pilus assembly protein n=1 Tax=Goekera deserti TaxID=2497753 RepID=A0A7K3WB73_9ACTN|nr:pilus assembly protein [Goekera deserti]NDI47818.1 pilus assembly protein [Goekera deserti]NEL53566.1 pilus assembly protein [Goekera deserti]
MLGDRGAAAVEFALLVPTLFLIVLGIVDLSRLMQVQASLSAAAREGARVMALTNDTDAAEEAVLVAAGSLPVLAGEVVVSPDLCRRASDADPATVPADPDATPGREDMDITQTVTVTVTYDQPLASGLLGLSKELTGTAVMRCGG